MKMAKLILISFSFCIMMIQCANKKDVPFSIKWTSDIEMPGENNIPNPGVAGAFTGISNGYLMIAGGANFPNGYPWEGGKKVFSPDIYCLNLQGKKRNEWQVYKSALPGQIAYGASVSIPGGILCIGGCNLDSCFADTYIMTMQENHPVIKSWTKLPVPLANCSMARIGNQIFIAGGQTTVKNACATNIFLKADLTAPEKGWQRLPDFPGAPRAYAVATAVKDGKDNCFFLFGGRNFNPRKEFKILTDGYKYNCKTQKWVKLKSRFPVMAACGSLVDRDWIILAGGTDGSYLLEEMDLKKKIERSSNADSVKYWTNILAESQKNNKGFDQLVRYYDWKNDNIAFTDTVSFAMPLTTGMVVNNNGIYIPSGEIRPGVRTPFVIFGSIVREKNKR